MKPTKEKLFKRNLRLEGERKAESEKPRHAAIAKSEVSLRAYVKGGWHIYEVEPVQGPEMMSWGANQSGDIVWIYVSQRVGTGLICISFNTQSCIIQYSRDSREVQAYIGLFSFCLRAPSSGCSCLQQCASRQWDKQML